jgi:acetolactate decarboxylase
LYDGCVTIGELKTLGHFGLGEYEALDGELIAYNGDFVRVTADGKLHRAADGDSLCFAQVADATFDKYEVVPANLTMDALATFLEPLQCTRNAFFAFTMTGLFASVETMAYPRQTKPYAPLATVQPSVATFSLSNVRGRLVGFYSPAFARDVGVPGYHCHFVDDATSVGGHVKSFTITEGSAAICRLESLVLRTPTYADYLHANLESA